MAKKGTSESRGQFLGTEQILQRVRDAQAPAWRTHGTRLLGIAGVAAVVVVLAVGLVLQHQNSATQTDDPLRDISHSGPLVVQLESDDSAATAAPRGAKSRAAAAAQPERLVVGSHMAPKDGAEAAVALRVEVRPQPGTIFVDGRRVAMERQWQAKLSRGKHLVVVRFGNSSMQHTLDLQHEATKLVFDYEAHRVHQQALVAPAKQH